MIVNILILIWLHFIADFVLQSDVMATKKSKENKWLLAHVAVYTLPFVFFGLKFALVNFAAHFVTDYITSRLSSKFFSEGKRHNFFVVIGADQAIHTTCLIASYVWLC